jgi:hypothetical protein
VKPRATRVCAATPQGGRPEQPGARRLVLFRCSRALWERSLATIAGFL